MSEILNTDYWGLFEQETHDLNSSYVYYIVAIVNGVGSLLVATDYDEAAAKAVEAINKPDTRITVFFR